jgi:hypothetical protein
MIWTNKFSQTNIKRLKFRNFFYDPWLRNMYLCWHWRNHKRTQHNIIKRIFLRIAFQK